MSRKFGKKFWQDLTIFTKEYWAEVAIFFVFITLMFAGWLYVF